MYSLLTTFSILVFFSCNTEKKSYPEPIFSAFIETSQLISDQIIQLLHFRQTLRSPEFDDPIRALDAILCAEEPGRILVTSASVDGLFDLEHLDAFERIDCGYAVGDNEIPRFVGDEVAKSSWGKQRGYDRDRPAHDIFGKIPDKVVTQGEVTKERVEEFRDVVSGDVIALLRERKRYGDIRYFDASIRALDVLLCTSSAERVTIARSEVETIFPLEALPDATKASCGNLVLKNGAAVQGTALLNSTIPNIIRNLLWELGVLPAPLKPLGRPYWVPPRLPS